MVTGACVTMGLVHLRTGLRKRPWTAHLLFALNAFVLAGYSVLEHALKRADNPARYLEMLRGLEIAAAALVVTIAAFVWGFFRTGRNWLAVLAIGLACVGLIAVLAITMPQLSGLDAARQLHLSHPEIHLVFLTVHDDADYARAAFAAGALGYVLKSRLASDLLPAIRAALAGHHFLSPTAHLDAAA